MFQYLDLEMPGTFLIGEVGDDRFQCGATGEREMQYHVRIICDPTKLTPEGFTIDRSKVKAYFEAKYRRIDVLPSCELMAMTACEDLAALVGPGACGVEVTMNGHRPEAGLTAIWTAEEGKAALGCLIPRSQMSTNSQARLSSSL